MFSQSSESWDTSTELALCCCFVGFRADGIGSTVLDLVPLDFDSPRSIVNERSLTFLSAFSDFLVTTFLLSFCYLISFNYSFALILSSWFSLSLFSRASMKFATVTGFLLEPPAYYFCCLSFFDYSFSKSCCFKRSAYFFAELIYYNSSWSARFLFKNESTRSLDLSSWAPLIYDLSRDASAAFLFGIFSMILFYLLIIFKNQ